MQITYWHVQKLLRFYISLARKQNLQNISKKLYKFKKEYLKTIDTLLIIIHPSFMNN